MSNVNVELTVVSPNGLGVGSDFQIEVRFKDESGLSSAVGAVSGYLDVNFDQTKMRVNSIDYASAYSSIQTGTIDNDNGVVNEVGAFSPAGAFTPPSDSLIFTLTAEVIAPGAITISTDAGEDVLSEITISGADKDQDGVGSNAVDETTFGSVSATFECFLTGTLITTDQGQRPVETLKIGDQIQTAEGTFEAIKWIGHQTFDQASTQPHPFRTYPILIKAGALGNSLPARDLYVSPDHALLVDGLLVNAGALTNESSIIQVEMEQFVYHHIELEKHSLLLAEGTAAESYLPQNQAREAFDNGDEYEELYPNHNILSLLPMSFPRVSSKRQLPRCVKKQLLEVAQTLPSAETLARV